MQEMSMTAKDWLPSAVLAAGMERVLSPGQALFRLGDRTAGIYEIVKGQVQMIRVDASGREVVLYAAGPGDIFAEAALFSPTYHCDAITKTGAVVRLFPKARVLPAFRENPKAAEAFMALLAREIMRLRTRLELRNIRSARERVLHFLVLNAGSDGRTVLLHRTFKEFAAELGLTHEAFYRALADLAADGEIKRSKNTILLRKS
jgi:CRP/FNR family transcriptional regulator, dissimilatory nitrate respiration regulator